MTGPVSRRWLGWLGALLLLAGLAAVAALAAQRWLAPAPARTQANALERLVQQCEADMLRGTCRVLSGPGAPSASGPADTVVFVAGVGAIDAAAYRQLRDAGQALCATVRQSCRADWAAPGCRAARALHGQT